MVGIMGVRQGQLLIAEVKTKSPFGWEAEESWEERFAIADEYGDWVAVHTEEAWGGSFELLEKARAKTNKQLLAKGIHATDESVERAIAAGADAVLVVGRLPRIYRDKCLIEPSNLYELRKLSLSGLRMVWNSRDVETGEPKTDPTTKREISFHDALSVYPRTYCQASYIRTPAEVHPEAKAVLVGTHLPEFVRELDR